MAYERQLRGEDEEKTPQGHIVDVKIGCLLGAGCRLLDQNNILFDWLTTPHGYIHCQLTFKASGQGH